MAEKHLTSSVCTSFATGLALILAAFGAQIAAWPHWISIGLAYGIGGGLVLVSIVLLIRTYLTVPQNEPSLKSLTQAQQQDQDAFAAEVKKWANGHNTGEVLKAGALALDLFTPLQMDALTLRKDLQSFLSSEKERFKSETSGDDATRSHMMRLIKHNPETQLIAGYELQLRDRAVAIANRFALEGLATSYEFKPLAKNAHTWNNVYEVSERLWKMIGESA